MKEIQLSKGMVAIVDDFDFDSLSKRKWVASKSGNRYYAVSTYYTDGVKKNLYMHRAIMGESCKGLIVDHKDRNSLNNTRSNLRVCNKQQNQANKTSNKNGSSGYLGVSWHTKAGKWTAMAWKDYRPYYLGLFDSEIDAALAYNKKATELHGEFASINTINPINDETNTTEGGGLQKGSLVF